MLHSFTKVPVLARVNGLFICNVPIEIVRLTMIEKLCIARARATRCCIELQGHGASHVSKGSLVILPQAASRLGRLLPLSATEIVNELVVIMVSIADQPITMDQISKELLTVRRDMILAALKWLQEHNPLYCDVGIVQEALETYPVNGPLPVPTFDNIASASTAAEGSSYFTSLPPPQMSRISAFMSIKNGEKFLVYPSGSNPMREWASPYLLQPCSAPRPLSLWMWCV
ncbi:hypothetical protein L202_06336 [Cryptococcus amylolentus CBS 6039]|uniref:DUF6570 domain-containing protein n=1 Tax=Cryptococcus amylolentus CBS 6039 TaxID=1295533 RepID=A0A1E3HFJ5_9TREE|nr:hypothetical protein L202_06336 [Cryptococcus amylolentus CBS 6039]ODN75129.1 hypothetical protein L202_06336 [Cryptococcus amylolentus CBS 6039]